MNFEEKFKEKVNFFLRRSKELTLSFSAVVTTAEKEFIKDYISKTILQLRIIGTGQKIYINLKKKKFIQFNKFQRTHDKKNYLNLKPKSRERICNLIKSDPLQKDEKTIDLCDSGDLLETNVDGYIASKEIKLCIPPSIKRRSTFETFRKELPIFMYKQKIIDTIEANEVTLICGETGSGKSTQVPQYILEECTMKGKECRIVCTQPRRLAATSISERVAHERMEKLGTTVGYQIRMNSCVSIKSNVIYSTSGYLLQCLLHEKPSNYFKNITHLILDEIHEREKLMDFLLISIRDVIQENRLPIKVILMSATLETEIFSNYFNNCPIINVPGKCFPVDVFHLNEIIEIIGNKKLVKSAFNENKIKAIDFQEEQENDQDFIRISKSRNNIDHVLLYSLIEHLHQFKPIKESLLVFLPGYEDIAIQKDILKSELLTDDYEIFILHSATQMSNNFDQNRVLQKLFNGRRKIILSTNIAETSITIDDVVYVIDVGKVKQGTYDSTTETSGLECTWVSQACAKQRTGRAGRTRNGQCYRLYSVEQYDKFQKFSTPEILRTSLSDICLFAVTLAIGNKETIEEYLQRAIQPPSNTVINQSIALLKCMDALDESENLTNLGRKLIQLPVDIRLGKCLLYGIFLQCLDPILTVISCLSAHDIFQIQPDADNQSINSIKMDFAKGKQSDLFMMMHIFNEWTSCKQSYQERYFSFRNFLSNSNMEGINEMRTTILSNLRQANYLGAVNRSILNKNSANYSIIKACLTAGLYPNICQIDCQNGRILSKQNAKIHIHRGSVLNGSALDRINGVSPMDWIIYGQKLQLSYFFVIRKNTVTSPANVAFLTGPINLNESNIFPFQQKRKRKLALDEDDELVYFWVDQWIHFIMKKKDAKLIYSLRQKVNNAFVKFLKNPFQHILDDSDSKVLDTLFYVIDQEDNTVDLID